MGLSLKLTRNSGVGSTSRIIGQVAFRDNKHVDEGKELWSAVTFVTISFYIYWNETYKKKKYSLIKNNVKCSNISFLRATLFKSVN